MFRPRQALSTPILDLASSLPAITGSVLRIGWFNAVQNRKSTEESTTW